MLEIRSFLVLPLLLVSIGNSQDWSAFRGSDGRGVFVDSKSEFSASGVGLNLRWKTDLGSGYSSVVVSGSKVITMYCDDQFDYVVCLDGRSGQTKWKTAVGDKFKGENGSFDGPISTPVIAGQEVFALDPGGKLVCLSLDSGKEVWSFHLVDDLGAAKPLYGFATSPIVIGSKLIVQTGATDAALTAFDIGTGKIAWKATNDKIDSQSPVAMQQGDSTIVLAAGGTRLYGVDPKDGKTLFEYEHKGGNGSAMVPVTLPDNNVVLTLDDAFSKAVSLRTIDNNQINVSEEWQERSIKNTYNVPVFCNDHLFAFSTRILTCVDPVTGKAKWKSRKPGDGFLVALNDILVINTKKGSLHIAKAESDKYTELSKLQLFDDLVWSLPACSDGAIYCRSLGQIACVDLVRNESTAGNIATVEMPLGKQFRQMINAVGVENVASERQRMVNEFVNKQATFPIIEDGIVHFVFTGEADDVAVAGDLFGARQERTMVRLSDTNLFFYAMELPDNQRANYVYLIDYKPGVDPRNSRKTTSSMYAGEMEFAVRLRGEKPLEMSWFGMSNWNEKKYLVGLEAKIQGEFVEHKVAESSDSADAEIYLPPGYRDSSEQYRTFFVFADPGYKTVGKLIPAIENIVSLDSDVDPAIIVFPRFAPFASQTLPFDKLVESIDKTYRTKTERKYRTTVGFGFMASGALSPLFKHQNLISNSAVYSPLIFDAEIRQLEAAAEKIDQPMNVYVEWGRFDTFNPHENWDVRKIGKKIFDLCAENSHIKGRGGMVNDSVDWSSWRNRYDAFVIQGD